MEINIKLLNENAKVPTRGSEYAAGYDLYAATNYDIEIAPHSTVKIGTGISVELPNGTFGAIFARSGLATKKGLRPANCVGVWDSDYRGEICVELVNLSNTPFTVEPGERIAQLVFSKYEKADFIEVEELSETERGTGGIGHTGLK